MNFGFLKITSFEFYDGEAAIAMKTVQLNNGHIDNYA